MHPSTPRFATVVLDVDSTLCGIEGIDWLAARKGEAVSLDVASQTDRAMRGEIRLDDVYASRLSAVSPRKEDVDALGLAYIDSLAAGAAAAVAAWKARGVRVILVSGGIRQAILSTAAYLGIDSPGVHAVNVYFDTSGAYAGFDETSPLATAMGKRAVVAGLDLPRPILALGDGSTDLPMRTAVDAFVAFTGFATRPAVVEAADFVVASFDELSGIVLGDDKSPSL